MTRPLALLCFAGFLLTAHAAAAKPKVALTQIEGDDSGDARDAVADALEGKELSLIASKEVNRAVDKLGDVADLKERDFKKLAGELEADVVVAGKLTKDKATRKTTLKFRLYAHKKMGGFTVSGFKDLKSEKFRSAVHDKVLDKIGASSADADADEDKPKKKKAADDEEDPLATKKDKKSIKKAKPDDEEEPRAKKTKADPDEGKPKKKAVEADADEAKPKKKAAEADADEPKPKKKLADSDDAPGSDDDAKPAKRSDADDEPAPRKTKKKVAAAEDGEELEAGVVLAPEPTRAANRAAVRLDVGPSVLAHSFKFNARAFDGAPKGPSLKPVPGVRFEAELYPLAVSNPSGGGAGLGLGIEYDKTLSAKLGVTTMDGSFNVPVKEGHYSVGLRYRLAFGRTATSPTLTLGVGYGKRMFSTDVSKLPADAQAAIRRDTPETNYTVIDPGLMLRLPLTRMIAFGFGGRGLVITNAGPIQNATSYGRAKVYGFEGTAALDFVFGTRFAVRLAGDFTQIGFSFTGVGNLSTGLDGDGTNQDVGGLADRSIGGSATLAVLY